MPNVGRSILNYNPGRETIYRCKRCGKEFDEYDADVFIATEDSLLEDWDFDGYPVCPYCQTLDVEEVREDDDSDYIDE